MSLNFLLNTILHLRPKQVFYQLWYRLHKPKYKEMEAPECVVPKLLANPIQRCHSLDGDVFSFLNLEHKFAGWNFTDNGMLWAYNQNYFDWLNQEGITAEEGCKWIDLFNSQLSTLNSQLSFDPYPIALRSINWIKFFCRFPECATKPRLDSLYSQVKLLEKKLEYHLLGNHLLEDAYALYIAANFFQDTKLLNKATNLLLSQLEEQTLPDGAHYEQSPMYHCILLDRLLDCINIAPKDKLKAFAKKQIGWLKSICYQDGSFPMFNDAALGIAPVPNDIIDYAQRMGIGSEATPLKESGYRKLSNTIMEAFVDVGNITATYQPGHSHADTFNYELRINGQPFIIDTSISTYNKTERRQYERSSAAHNTVTIDSKDSSEVWGGFRVGSRARVTLLNDTSEMVSASHNGFGPITHKRMFAMTEDGFSITDELSSSANAISYIHFAPKIEVLSYTNKCIVTSMGSIEIDGADEVRIMDEKASNTYNQFHDIRMALIRFNTRLNYCMKP